MVFVFNIVELDIKFTKLKCKFNFSILDKSTYDILFSNVFFMVFRISNRNWCIKSKNSLSHLLIFDNLYFLVLINIYSFFNFSIY